MKTYQVEITEALKKTIEVEASSREEAKIIANEQWKKGEHILDADNFTTVEFKAQSQLKNKKYER
jgi:hypothetical protein